MNFVELRVKSATSGQANENFVPITFNIKFINFFAPYKSDTDCTVVKCEDKTAYICNLPYDEVKKLLGSEVVSSKNKEPYDMSDWYY